MNFRISKADIYGGSKKHLYSKSNSSHRRTNNNENTPCFAVCRPVCDLFGKYGKVPDKAFLAVSGVCRELRKSNICSKYIVTNVRICYTEHIFDKSILF